MICQKGHIKSQCKPLCCTKKHDTEESMDEVLWKYKLEEKYKPVIKMPGHLSQLLIWKAGGNQISIKTKQKNTLFSWNHSKDASDFLIPYLTFTKSRITRKLTRGCIACTKIR